MTMETNTTITTCNDYIAVAGETRFSKRMVTRITYDKQAPAIKRSFFPAAPLDAQSLAGTGALVFEGEMVGNGH